MLHQHRATLWQVATHLFICLVSSWAHAAPPAITRYAAPPAVTALSDKLNLTPLARAIFFKARPQISDSKQMSANCPVNEKLSTLGCYSRKNGIFLFRVQAPDLAGLAESVAAHELLHAVYDQLDARAKTELSTLLNKMSLGNDELLHLSYYRDWSKAHMEDELHSLVGTEVANLPPELEAHYAKYFGDRQKIVGFHRSYKLAITAINETIQKLDAELKARKIEIDAHRARLLNETEVLERDRKEQGVDVANLNERIRKFNEARNAYGRLVIAYNELVEKTNATKQKSNEILAAMDTHGDAPPTKPLPKQ